MSLIEAEWKKLLEDCKEGIKKAIIKLKEKEIENIPGAKEALLKKFENMERLIPRENGEILKKSIEEKIQDAFFPNLDLFHEAFEQILKSRTHEQDFIINELVNGFITSKAKAIASNSQVPIIDRMVEAFSKRDDFHIVDHQFFAMFGDPNKPKSYVKKNLQDLINLFGLVSKKYIIDRDKRTSEEKIYTFYTFPPEILEILKKKYIIIETMETIFIEILLELYKRAENDKVKNISIELSNKSLRFIDDADSSDINIIREYLPDEIKNSADINDIKSYKEIDSTQSDKIKLPNERLINIFNWGRLIWKSKEKILYFDKKNGIFFEKEGKRLINGTEIILIFYNEIENELKEFYINRFKKIIHPIENADLRINKKSFRPEKKEINLTYSINKDLKDIDLTYARVSEEFDRNVFISLFLANLTVNRKNLKKIGGIYTINGISAIFSLIFILSLMPKITVDKKNPINNDPLFDKNTMSVIPKSWLIREVLEPLFVPLIKVIAFQIGGRKWSDKIKIGEATKRIHQQVKFLLKDVNKWILGNLCRVEVPIFVEISNIFIEAEISLDRDQNDNI